MGMERANLASLINRESIKSKYHSYQPLLKSFQEPCGFIIGHFDEPFDLTVDLGSIHPLLSDVSFHLKRAGDYVESSFDDKSPPQLISNESLITAASTKILTNRKVLVDSGNIIVMIQEDDGIYRVKDIQVEQTDGIFSHLIDLKNRSLQCFIQWIVVCSPFNPSGFKFNNCIINVFDGAICSIETDDERHLQLFSGGAQPGPTRLIFSPPPTRASTEIHMNFGTKTTFPFEFNEISQVVVCSEIPVTSVMFTTDDAVKYFVSLSLNETPGHPIEQYLMNIHEPGIGLVESFERFWERILQESIKYSDTKITKLALIPVLKFRGPFDFDVVFAVSANLENAEKKWIVNLAGSSDLEVLVAPVSSDNFEKIKVEPTYTEYFSKVYYFSPCGITIITNNEERVSVHDKESFNAIFLDAVHVFLDPKSPGGSFLNPLHAMYESIIAEIEGDQSFLMLYEGKAKDSPDPHLAISSQGRLVPLFSRLFSNALNVEKLIPLGYIPKPLPYSISGLKILSSIPSIIEFTTPTKTIYCYSLDGVNYSTCFESKDKLKPRRDPIEFIRSIEGLTPLPMSIILKNKQALLLQGEHIGMGIPYSIPSLSWLDFKQIDGKLALERGKLNLAGLIDLLGVNCFDAELLTQLFDAIFEALLNYFRDRLEKLLGEDFSKFIETYARLRQTFNVELLDFISGFLHLIPFKAVSLAESSLLNGLKFPLFNVPLPNIEPVRHVALRDTQLNTTTESIQHCALVFGKETKQTALLDVDILAPLGKRPPCCDDPAMPLDLILDIEITTMDLDSTEPLFSVTVHFAHDHSIIFSNNNYAIDTNGDVPYANDERLLDIITRDSPVHPDFPILIEWRSSAAYLVLDIKRSDGRLLSKDDIEHLETFIKLLDRKPIKLENRDKILAELEKSKENIDIIHFTFAKAINKEIVLNLLQYAWKGVEPTEPQQILPQQVLMPGEDWTIHQLITIKTLSQSGNTHFYPIKVGDHLHFGLHLIDFLKDDDHVAAMAAAPEFTSMILQVKRQQTGQQDAAALDAIREREGKLAEMKQLKEKIGSNQKDSPIYKRLVENIAQSSAFIEKMRESVEKASGISVFNFKYSINDSLQITNADGAVIDETITEILPDFMPLQSSWSITEFTDRIDEHFTSTFTQVAEKDLIPPAKPRARAKPATATPATPTPSKQASAATMTSSRSSRYRSTVEAITPLVNVTISTRKKPKSPEVYLVHVDATKTDDSSFSETKRTLASNRKPVSQRDIMKSLYARFAERAKKLKGCTSVTSKFLEEGKKFSFVLEFNSKTLAPGTSFDKLLPELKNQLVKIFSETFAEFSKDFNLTQTFEQGSKPAIQQAKPTSPKPTLKPSTRSIPVPKPASSTAQKTTADLLGMEISATIHKKPKVTDIMIVRLEVKKKDGTNLLPYRNRLLDAGNKLIGKAVAEFGASNGVSHYLDKNNRFTISIDIKTVAIKDSNKTKEWMIHNFNEFLKTPPTPKPAKPRATPATPKPAKPRATEAPTTFKLPIKKPLKKIIVTVEKHPTSFTVTFEKSDKSVISKKNSPTTGLSQYGIIVSLMNLLYRNAITSTDYENNGQQVVLWLDGRQIKDEPEIIKSAIESKLKSSQENFWSAETS